ncbi:hypothetical protein D9M71_774370 [compost metagenome]
MATRSTHCKMDVVFEGHLEELLRVHQHVEGGVLQGHHRFGVDDVRLHTNGYTHAIGGGEVFPPGLHMLAHRAP